MEKSMKKIDLLESILMSICPIIQLPCMLVVVFFCENEIIDTCIVCFQLFLIGVQFFLPKLLRKVVMKKQTKKLIEKIEDGVNL